MFYNRSVARKSRRLVSSYKVWILLMIMVLILQFLQLAWMASYTMQGKPQVTTFAPIGKVTLDDGNQRIVTDVNKNNLINQTLYNGRCRMMTAPWGKNLLGLKWPSDMKDWSFTQKRKCDRFDERNIPTLRTKMSLDCSLKEPTISLSQTDVPSDIFTLPFGDPCLASFIDNCCIDENPVPNIVHYVWYADKELQYFNFLSLMSVIRFKKPCVILIHGPFVPSGPYWDYIIQLSPNIVHVYRERPTEVFGNKLKYREHASDIMRIEALIAYGGVYLDFDEIILRPIDSLRRYVHTQGHELTHTLGSQLVMSKKNNTFLHLWYQSYKDNYRHIWAYNALWVPNTIAKSHPELIHVEGYNFTRPNWKDTELIYHKNYDWSTNYGMHMYARWYKMAINPQIIRTLNTTIGSVSRHVLLGNKELCDI